MSDIQRAIDATISDLMDECCRKGLSPQRCSYHQGMQHGADLAVQMIQISPAADVEDLWGEGQ